MKRVCYVMPASALRRPIKELLAQKTRKQERGLLIPTLAGKRQRSPIPGVTIHTYRAISLPFSPFEWPIPSPRFFIEALRVLRSYDVIHVYAHFYLTNLLLFFLALFYPKKRVILTIDVLPGYSASFGILIDTLFRVYTWTLCRLLYWRADVVTLYGKALVPAALRSGIAKRKITVLPTGILPLSVNSTKTRSSITKHLGIASASSLVTYVGFLNPRKRVQDLITIAAAMPTVHFLIIGSGPHQRILANQIRERGLTNVHLLDYRDDAQAIIAASDVFLFPSSVEGLPGAVMESMLVGTPVVTTRIPCTTDLITDGKEGFLCAVGDTVAMRRRVEELLANKTLATRFAAAAQKKIRRDYSWQHLKSRYDALYEAA